MACVPSQVTSLHHWYISDAVAFVNTPNIKASVRNCSNTSFLEFKDSIFPSESSSPCFSASYMTTCYTLSCKPGFSVSPGHIYKCSIFESIVESQWDLHYNTNSQLPPSL